MTTRVRCQLPGACWRLSARSFYWGLVTCHLCLACPQIPGSQRESRCEHEAHCVMGNLPSVLRMMGSQVLRPAGLSEEAISGRLLHDPQSPRPSSSRQGRPLRQLPTLWKGELPTASPPGSCRLQSSPCPCPPSVLTLLVSRVSLIPSEHLEKPEGLEVTGCGSPAVLALGVDGVTNCLAWW